MRGVMATILALTALLSILSPATAEPVGQSKALTPLRVIALSPHATMVLGEALGYFAAEGLTVSWELTGSSTAQMQGLIDGRADVTITAFDNLLASATREGIPSVAFATVDVATSSLLVRPEIRTYDDLRGRPLAVDAVDTAFALVLRKLLLAHGLDLERGDYALVPVGGPQPRLQSLLRGETFAALLGTGSEAAAPEGGLWALGHYSEVLPDYPGLQLAATADWLASPANRDLVVRLLRAWRRAAVFAIDPTNRSAAREVLTSSQGLSVAAADRALNVVTADLRLDPDGLTGVRALRAEFGYLPPTTPTNETLYDLTLYERAQR